MEDQSKPIKLISDPPKPPVTEKGKPISELTVKVNIDCSDALKGLKAVQREARKATQAVKELDRVQAGVKQP